MRILEKRKIDVENKRIYFVRIDPEDINVTIGEIIDTLNDMSWINSFDRDYIKTSFSIRAQQTANYLANKIVMGEDDVITKETGEYVVSELARRTLVDQFGYLDIPLAELFKEKVSGNSGFDFYSGTSDKLIIFGEAKYKSKSNAYGRGMKQVDRFIRDKQDESDFNDIDKFFEEVFFINAENGKKAYAIAFSVKNTTSDKLINRIKKNLYYEELKKQKEIIYLAVDV